MNNSDAIMNAARSSLMRARAGSAGDGARPSLNDNLVRGAALGAVASLPFAGIGLVGGAVLGASVAALDHLTKD
jgi:hypothetical protein